MLVAALVIIGLWAVYIASQRMLRRACAQLRHEFQEQIDSLSRTLEASRVAQPNAACAPASATAGSEEVTPETLAVIGASVAALVGKEVRISPAKTLLTPNPIRNPWARQGRVIVQSSHDLRPARTLATSAVGPASEVTVKGSAA